MRHRRSSRASSPAAETRRLNKRGVRPCFRWCGSSAPRRRRLGRMYRAQMRQEASLSRCLFGQHSRRSSRPFFFLPRRKPSARRLLWRGSTAVPSGFELIELFRQQDLASRRADPHVHIAFLQELPRLLQGGSRRVATQIDAAGSIVAANQVLHSCCAIHAGQPLQIPRAQETAGRSPATRSSRMPNEIETSTLLFLSFGGSVRYPQSPVEAAGWAVMSNSTLTSWE